jgi:hypothetical protein
MERPDLKEFQSLKSHADRYGAWPQWREKAYGHIRTVLAAEKAAVHGKPTPWSRKPDHSTIVRFLIWEKHDEDAWKEALEGGCSEELWFELARLREKRHPAEVIPIYQRQVEAELARKDIAGYQAAVKTMKDIERLMTKTGAQAAFSIYRLAVRNAHHQKRNFMKLLDQVRWEGGVGSEA